MACQNFWVEIYGEEKSSNWFVIARGGPGLTNRKQGGGSFKNGGMKVSVQTGYRHRVLRRRRQRERERFLTKLWSAKLKGRKGMCIHQGQPGGD